MSKSQALVAHTCNPSFLGGRHQENHSSKPAQVNSLLDSISKKKKNHKKWGAGVAQGVGPEFKPRYWKKEDFLKTAILMTNKITRRRINGWVRPIL
jgi:hypothetical protein